VTTIRPPWWEPEDFQRDLERAVELFRARRLREPVDQYRKEFDKAVERVETLLRNTDNLTGTLPGAPNSPEVALGLLADEELRVVLRYMAGPPISEDDLKTLAEAPSLAPMWRVPLPANRLSSRPNSSPTSWASCKPNERRATNPRTHQTTTTVAPLTEVRSILPADRPAFTPGQSGVSSGGSQFSLYSRALEGTARAPCHSTADRIPSAVDILPSADREHDNITVSDCENDAMGAP